MKVIFLDNDGVICLSNNWGSRFKKQKKYKRKFSESLKNIPIENRFDDFDKDAIKILNDILEETNAEIVVSSDWRFHATLSELGEYYLSQGIIKSPISTISLSTETHLCHRRVEFELVRSIEINEWLPTHPGITHWVAIDDLNMSVEHLQNIFSHKDIPAEKPGLTNFILTDSDLYGIKQNNIKGEILKYLN